MAQGCVVLSITKSRLTDLILHGHAGFSCCRQQVTMPATMSLASIGLFDLKASSSSNLSPGSQGLLPPKWTGRSCTTARGGQPGSCSPSFGLLCSVVLRSHSPSGSSTSGFRLWRHLELLLALSQGLAPAAAFSLIRASLQRRIDFVLGLAICPGHQRLRLSGGGYLSLASGFDAGVTLGQGWSNTPLIHACQRLRVRLPSCPRPATVNASPRG